MLRFPHDVMAMKSRLFLCLLVLLGLAAVPAAAQFAPVASPTGPVMAGPYIVVDAATGETLLQSNPGAAWYPASLTKLMTIYLAFEELKAGRLTLAMPIVFSKHAHDMEPVTLGVPIGGTLTVEQALMALVVRSPNDVAVALAEHISGNEPRFVERMNATAARLGMTASQFANANGLPNSGQFVTARDLAVLTIALIHDFPEYYGYFQTHDFVYGKQRLGPGVHFVELYSPYADGLKTGFICASGFNLVGSAVRDGRRLVAVALGFRRADLRDEFMVRLFDDAFALKTSGARPKVWQLRNEGGMPPTVLPYGVCGSIQYDMPGNAVWLGNYPTWSAAKRVFDAGQSALAAMGAAVPGKEWILPDRYPNPTRQAAIIADLPPESAQKLCADYRTRKQFCEVKKAAEITPPFSAFWR
jgi:D-alanyl-D-alanine carboxypeptidase